MLGPRNKGKGSNMKIQSHNPFLLLSRDVILSPVLLLGTAANLIQSDGSFDLPKRKGMTIA